MHWRIFIRNEIAQFVSTSVAINITKMITILHLFRRFYREVLIAIIARPRFSTDKLLVAYSSAAFRADSMMEVSALN